MTIVCQHNEDYEGEGYYGVSQYHYRRYLLHKLILRSPPLFVSCLLSITKLSPT